jgi:hypothetical protein
VEIKKRNPCNGEKELLKPQFVFSYSYLKYSTILAMNEVVL